MDEIHIPPTEIKDVRREGKTAYIEGKSREDNPYQGRVDKVRAEYNVNLVLACQFDKGWIEEWRKKENPSKEKYRLRAERWD